MRNRIAEIDGMFAGSTSWGSWMVMCANEHEQLVNDLRCDDGMNITDDRAAVTCKFCLAQMKNRPHED